MEYSTGPFSERTETLLAQLSNELDAIGADPPPETLWHYTGTDGIREMMSHSRIRLSHARFLNDPTEVLFGWSVVESVLDREISRGTNLKPFFEMARSVAGEVYHATHYFTFCLSARPDSLSQWRAYGSGGDGYALAFQSAQLATCTQPDITCDLLQMRYGEKDQRELLDSAVAAATAFFTELLRVEVNSGERFGIAHRANVLLSKFLILAALSFKDSSFEDEKEWRLVAAVHPNDPNSGFLLKQLGFRSGGSVIKPFLEMPREPGKKRLPVAEIMFGPTLRPAITRESLEFFLAQRGYSAVTVVESQVPLQA